MDDAYLDSLDRDRLRAVSKKLLADLKDARDQLERNPKNSSAPPSSRPAWLGVPMDEKDEPDACEEDPPADNKKKPKSDQTADSPESSKKPEVDDALGKPPESAEGKKRKAGKQPGAPGYGRTQVIPHSRLEIHRAPQCVACGEVLSPDALFVAKTGHHLIDIKELGGQCLGLELECTLHHYGETECACGHQTQIMPSRGDVHVSVDGSITTRLSEWRLIGPRLASFIVFLTLRMRLSRKRVQEFLFEWLGLRVSTGTIDNCLRESALAALPIYLLLLNAISKESMVHADETPWREKGTVPWLWAFISSTIVLFAIGKRRQEVVLNILTANFAGLLVSDGLGLYRIFPKRLRCLAHLIRKAQGLAESLTEEAREFGKTALMVLAMVFGSRSGKVAPETVQRQLSLFQAYCVLVTNSARHQNTLGLAGEFLNDWDAIWRVVGHPEWPATNNVAERILRHWVIARKISHGTRTAEGSQAVAVLASIIETCRLRGVKIWEFLTQVITARRRGEPPPLLPLPAIVG